MARVLIVEGFEAVVCRIRPQWEQVVFGSGSEMKWSAPDIDREVGRRKRVRRRCEIFCFDVEGE